MNRLEVHFPIFRADAMAALHWYKIESEMILKKAGDYGLPAFGFSL